MERGATKSKRYPAPRATDYKGSYQADAKQKAIDRGYSPNLPEEISSGNGGKLNPDWVELLMGWPEGWSDIDRDEVIPIESWDDGWDDGISKTTNRSRFRAARLKAIGNGQCPQAMVLVYNLLK